MDRGITNQPIWETNEQKEREAKQSHLWVSPKEHQRMTSTWHLRRIARHPAGGLSHGPGADEAKDHRHGLPTGLDGLRKEVYLALWCVLCGGTLLDVSKTKLARETRRFGGFSPKKGNP